MLNPGKWPAFVRVSLRYGILTGVVGFGLLLILYYMGRHPFLFPIYLDFRIFLFGIMLFFALKEVRDYHNGGSLYFWQGMMGSFLFVVSFGLVAGSLLLGFTHLVPDFVASYISLFEAQAKTFPPEVIERIGKDVYERNLLELPATQGIDLALLYFWQGLMIGLFISIIISVILRKQPNP